MSISAKEIAESYKGFKVKAVTQKNDCITLYEFKPEWDEETETYQPIEGRVYIFFDMEITEFIGKEAKDCIYVLEEPEKWIGRLCWLWDEDDVEDRRVSVGVLKGITSGGKYLDSYHTASWSHCRPVKPDEVQFVEE